MIEQSQKQQKEQTQHPQQDHRYALSLPYWLAARHTPDFGMATFNKLSQQGLSIVDIFQASAAQLQTLGVSPKVIAHLHAGNWPGVERDQEWCAAAGAHILTWDHPEYPEKIKHIPDPPMILYARGNTALLAQISIAIVGSRNASYAGHQQAQRFARTLASAGIVITSGLARGIDGEAHAGALSVAGKTTAVFGTGLDTIYPSQHRKLAEQILAGEGLLLSEFPIGTAPHPSHFPRRNRIISGVSQGVLVVEATLKSGSLITAQLALEQGRDVYAIPGAVTNPNAAGCHYLIQQGAALAQQPEDILQALALSAAWGVGVIPLPITTPPQGKDFTDLRHRPSISDNAAAAAFATALTPAAQHCLACIDYELTPSEVIYQRYEGNIDGLQATLLELELQGVIYFENGGYVRCGG